MATLDTHSQLSFAEVAKRLAPDGSSLRIAEVLSEENPILNHAPYFEANNVFSHREARRLSEPTPTWRKVNSGVAVTASRTTPVTDTIGICEDYCETDVEVINAFKDKKAARMQEAQAHIEGMRKEIIATLLYGTTATAPEEFNGFATRMPSLSTSGNVLGCGGTGSDTTSVYVVMWGVGRAFMVYPRNSTAGIKHEDKGIVTISDATTVRANTSQYEAYRDHFVAKCGLVVKDDRAIARLANIETAYNATSNIFNEDYLIILLNRMPIGPKWIYVNDTVASQMQIASKDKNNVNYTPASGEELSGYMITRFNGHPVYKLDQILITEDAIS